MEEENQWPQSIINSISAPIMLVGSAALVTTLLLVKNYITSRKDSAQETLKRLIKQNREEHHIQYSTGLTNHMSQGLIALYKLGATNEQLETFYINYCKGKARGASPLEPMPRPSKCFTDDDWRDCIGTHTRYEDYIVFFQEKIAKHGIKDTVYNYVINEGLAEGVGGAAFHGLLQLGYGIEIMDKDNIAEGLAYMAYSFLPLGKVKTPLSFKELFSKEVSGTTKWKDHFELLNAMHNDPELKWLNLFGDKTYTNGFTGRMLKLKNSPLLKKYEFTTLNIPTEINNTEKLCEFLMTSIVEVFAGCESNSFFLLHLVTSCRALITTIHLFDDPQAQLLIICYYWQAAISAYLIIKRPQISKPVFPDETWTWEYIKKKAIETNAVHLIKLVFVLNECEKEYGENPLWKGTATQATKSYLVKGEWRFLMNDLPDDS